jgi:Xaa-Pro dipeptidase
MLSRRSFLLNSTVAAVGLPTAVHAQRRRESAEVPLTGPLPPSIAALQSMTGLVRPITNAEREARIEKARALMAKEKIDAIVLTGGATPEYFANVQLGGGERLWALVMPSKSNPFIICPAFEEERAREIIAGTPVEKEAAIRTWQEDESPYELLIKTLKDRGIGSGRVGIEETVKFVFADGIAHAGGPSFQVVSATPVTAGCRMIKDAHEVECLRIAGQATIRVYEAVYKALKEGMTQRDVSALVQAAYARVGFAGGASLNIGEYTASPHGSRTPQTIREVPS